MRRKRERERKEKESILFVNRTPLFGIGFFPENSQNSPRELWYIAAWIYKVCKYVEG